MLRERRINGPIILVVLAFLAWTIIAGVLAIKGGLWIDRHIVHHHVHTADCWDE